MRVIPSLFDAPAMPVGELCRRIKSALDLAFPSRVRVAGEVSRCSVATSGHVYFTLKDRDGLIGCVCWRTQVALLDVRFPLADGTAVEVVGRVGVYKDRSQYQIFVDDIVPAGHGDLHRRFERLKEKLRLEGLFDDARKRPVPSFVRSVAIVTSRSAAALQDFLTTCRRRGAHVVVTLVHAPVQGEAAARLLSRAIERAGRLAVDVVVVARGGGSLEDLWAFNTEAVARAIARCAKPVISAIGHETDVTIADFVADRRAPTPTAAAEMVAPDRSGLLRSIQMCVRRMRRSVIRSATMGRAAFDRALRGLLLAPQSFLGDRAQSVDLFEAHVVAADPRKRAAALRLRIIGARQQLRFGISRSLATRTSALDVLSARLQVLGPAATLERGYAIVFDEKGAVVRDAAVAPVGTNIDIALARGRLPAVVREILEDVAVDL